MISLVCFWLLQIALGSVRIPLGRTQNSPQRAERWAQETRARQTGLKPPRNAAKYWGLVGATPIEPMENYYDEVWIGVVGVGTPVQSPFNVVLDTGSANFWIPDISCNEKGCVGKDKFDGSKSSTYKELGSNFFIPYGTGHVSGKLVNDTVAIAGVSVVGDELGVATGMAEFFEDTPIDGILGLGFSDITLPPGIPTVFDNMIAQQLLDQNLFSVYLSNHEYTNESVIIFGGIDNKYIAPGGNWTYAPVNEPSYWLINMESVKVQNKIVHPCVGPNGCPVVVDTGTSIIAGPKEEVQPLINAIGPVNPDCSNVDSLPNIAFQIQGIDFVVTPQIYVIYETLSNGTTCLLGIEGISAIEVGPLWILGDPFLRQYYSVYDRTTKPPRVGFAPAVQPASPSSKPTPASFVATSR